MVHHGEGLGRTLGGLRAGVLWAFGDQDMVPPGSIIYWGDYETPEALADYLLSFDAEKLAEARAWKTQPVGEWGGYANTRKFGHLTLLPRFCEAGTRARLR